MLPAATRRLLSSPARRAVALAVLGLVLAVHAGVLWRDAPPAVPAVVVPVQRAPALAVRTLAVAPPPSSWSLPTPRPAADRPALSSGGRVRVAPAAQPLQRAAVAPRAHADSAGTAPAPQSLVAPLPLPRYRTRMPPPTRLQYTLSRAGQAEPAELNWQPEAARYRIALLGYASEGGFDSEGIAPERHTESRRGRAGRAVNFQRGAGRISFSGSQGSAELTPGAQDRLSWLVQLAAVLAAEPDLRGAGSEVQMVVAGVRGEPALWRFTVLAEETLLLPAGMVPAALHLQHRPSQPYAMTVDVWLDPARHFLPVQLQMQRPGTPPGAPGNLELRLTAADP